MKRLLCLLGFWMLTSLALAAPRPLSIGITPVFLDDQATVLTDWQHYLESRLLRPVRFVQRASYREVVELVRDNKLDFAWICGDPYMRNKDRLQLVTVPLYHGKPLYESYLIVPVQDTHSHSMLDMKGRVFAFSDPDSNSGWLVPQWVLGRLGQDSGHFFRKTFFTYAHRKVVEAVAANLAEGGEVDGYVWDTLARLHPEITSKTRIVTRFGPFGFPPIVASPSLAAAQVAQMRAVLDGMANDPQGRALLARLNLDGFVPGSTSLFDSIGRMLNELDGTGK